MRISIRPPMQSIAEMPEYSRQAERLLSAAERQAIVDHLAAFPTAGVILQGSGGVRKLRWSRHGVGKSGGVRVIYYFFNEQMPLYLLSVFGKGEKSDLSNAECNSLAKLVRILVDRWSVSRE